MMNEHSLLPHEESTQFPPTLAAAIGVNEAIVLSKLYALQNNKKNGKQIGDDRWIFNSYEQWRDQYFPFWSTVTIRRIFKILEEAGMVVTLQPEGSVSRRKYYRVPRSAWAGLTKERFAAAKEKRLPPSVKGSRSDQVDRIEKVKLTSSSYIGNGTVGTKDKEEGVFHPRFAYPETRELMESDMDTDGEFYDYSFDGNFFEQMVKNNWMIGGNPVWDWKATFRARYAHNTRHQK